MLTQHQQSWTVAVVKTEDLTCSNKILNPPALLGPQHSPKLISSFLTGNKKNGHCSDQLKERVAVFVSSITSVFWNADTTLELELENKAISLLIAQLTRYSPTLHNRGWLIP